MWDVWDVGCSGCRMFGRWGVQGVECAGCGMFGMWDVGDVVCLGCGMFEMWDVWVVGCEIWDVCRDVGCLFTKCQIFRVSIHSWKFYAYLLHISMHISTSLILIRLLFLWKSYLTIPFSPKYKVSYFIFHTMKRKVKSQNFSFQFFGHAVIFLIFF